MSAALPFITRLHKAGSTVSKDMERRELVREVRYLGGHIVWDEQPPPLHRLGIDRSNPTRPVAYRGLVTTEGDRDRWHTLDNLCALRAVCRDLLASYGEPGDPRWRHLADLLRE